MRRLLGARPQWSLVLFDLGALAFAIFFAFSLRLGWPIKHVYLDFLQNYIVPFIVLKLAIFYFFGLYRRFWRYASIHELRILIQAGITSSLAVLAFSYGMGTLPIPRSVLVVDGLVTLFLVGGVRLTGRALREFNRQTVASVEAKRVLIAGAGDAGEMLAREMQRSPDLGYLPVGFVDDDRRKLGMWVHGIKVQGAISDLPDLIEAYDTAEVIIAMPSTDRRVKAGIVRTCKQAHVPCRTLPGVYELIDGRVSLSSIREVRIEDVLGRDPVKVDIEDIRTRIRGAAVMVTGAGGSIGSALCRQVGHFEPSLLIIVDIAENSLYHIEQELLESGLGPVIAVVANVKDTAKMNEIFQAYGPQFVFHAAAYKHVPLIEMNPKAALTNNFIGTVELAKAAAQNGVAKFVLISTDKAVSPENFMGLSKALAEQAVLTFTGEKTDFIIVRFGNVLASSGSVVPTFQRQIAAGGPVTVTHPEMRRYLMTITESVQLVLQATVFGENSDVFLLDMGEPIAIVDLAKKLINLSGFSEDKIKIKFIGKRPGEKLDEELMGAGERLLESPHSKIFKLAGTAVLGPDDSRRIIEEMENALKRDRLDICLTWAERLVPGVAELGSAGLSSAGLTTSLHIEKPELKNESRQQ